MNKNSILADTGAILAKVRFLLLIFTVSTLACGGTYLVIPTPQAISTDLYPSPSAASEATQTERVITTTPLPTLPSPSPIVVVYTSTPVLPIISSATPENINWLCVTAQEAVYLRPSPSTENYPIIQLKNGQKVKPEGGRTGSWTFVSFMDKRGWVNQKYLSACK